MVRYLFYTIGDLTYQSPLVQIPSSCVADSGVFPFSGAVDLYRMWKHSLFAVGIVSKVCIQCVGIFFLMLHLDVRKVTTWL